jgi:hypothetical protein
MTDADYRKNYRKYQKEAHDLVTKAVTEIREIEAAIAANPHAKRMFQMRDNLRRQRKMLNTLDRKIQFAGSSLFLNNADEKLLKKMERSQFKLTNDIHKLVLRTQKEVAEFRAYAERLAKERQKNGK